MQPLREKNILTEVRIHCRHYHQKPVSSVHSGRFTFGASKIFHPPVNADSQFDILLNAGLRINSVCHLHTARPARKFQPVQLVGLINVYKNLVIKKTRSQWTMAAGLCTHCWQCTAPLQGVNTVDSDYSYACECVYSFWLFFILI